jgi:TolB-like protein
MVRLLSQPTRMLAVLAAFAFPGVMAAQADTRPVVVVFRFDNNSIGAGKADFDGMATGVQDLLITDLASNARIRLVDRTHLNEILSEQNLAKTGPVDPTTAVRIGKILGAQYAVTGGFISDGKGTAVMTGRTIDIETTQIINPQKIQGKTDNVLGLIADLSSKVSSNMNLAPKPGAGRPSGAQKSDPPKSDAPKSTAPKSSGQAGAAQSGKTSPAATAVDSFAHAPSNPAALRATKLDVARMKIYSNALDEMDQKHYAQAKVLFTQVLNDFPDFEPAKRQLDKLAKVS